MTKSVTLTPARQLWMATLRAYRAHFWRYTLIVLVVSIPNTIFGALSASDPTISAYGSLAALFMNAALIYAIVRGDAQRRKLREYYYDSSAGLLRYIIVGVIIALLLIPAAFGLSIVNAGAWNQPSIGEIVLLSIVGLVVATPSIYFCSRFSLALIGVFDGDDWPVAALRSSWRLTKGRFWRVLARLIILGLGLIIAVIPIAFVCIGLYVVTQALFFESLLTVATAAVLLPLFYLYLHQLYGALGGERD